VNRPDPSQTRSCAVRRRPSASVSALLVALASSALFGCAGGYRFGASTTLDTELRAGFLASAAGDFGIAPSKRRAIVQVVGVEGGFQANPGAAVVGPIVGIEYLHETDEAKAAWRIGLRGRIQFVFENDRVRQEGGSGVAVAVLPILGRTRGGAYVHLGAELQGIIMAPLDPDDNTPLEGFFAGGIVFEVEKITTLSNLFSSNK
jgi:hypothetical protein